MWRSGYTKLMKFISHRGAGGLGLENSLDAIRQGDSYRPEYIEIDLNLTSDSLLVLHHGKISRGYRDIPLSDASADIFQNSPHTPTLQQLLAKPPRSRLLIDLKSQAATNALLPLIKQHQCLRQAAYTSPHLASLRLIRQELPEAVILFSQPYHESPMRQLDLARRYHFTGIAINKWWLSPLTYWVANKLGLTIMVYTVNRQFTMRLINFFFPRVLVCTDHPELAAKIQ